MSSTDLKRYRENRQEEIDSAAQYNYLAASENDARLAGIYRGLAQVEEKHARFWKDQIIKAGGKAGAPAPSWRSRTLILIARYISRKAVVASIAREEYRDRDKYARQPETASTSMAAEERQHAQMLGALVSTPHEGVSGSALASMEGRHKSATGNTLRAAVLGANDGLCTNLSLVMGVAGAAMSSHQILLAGMAGLLAGAFSMALGEFVSVTSARELAQREIRIEAEELEANSEGETEELELIYRAKGLSDEEARSTARHLMADKSKALDTLVREELGIDPAELGGSAWQAAVTSLILFSAGAIIPVLPFFFCQGETAVWFSVACSAFGLFGIGAAITIFTGASVLVSGGRQLLLGLAAAGLTFGIGRLLGAVL